MSKKAVLLFASLGVLASLVMAILFFSFRISDRNLLIESLQEYEKAAGSPRRVICWEVFCQQAAQGYYDDAMRTILRSPDDRDTQYVLVALVKIRARNGDFQGALDTARTYSVLDTREKAIQEIAVAQAERGEVRDAHQTISLLTDPHAALQAVAIIQAQKGDLQGAHETIATVPHPNDALAAVGEYQIKSGDFQGALETAAQMSSDSNANLLLDIGFELEKRGEQSLVRGLASHIVDRKLADEFVLYARLAQSTMHNVKTVEANICDQADFDSTKGDFSAAYDLIGDNKCWYSFVAIKQYDTDPVGAERALLRSPVPEDICFGLTQFALVAASKEHVTDALRFVDAAQGTCGEKYSYRLAAVREVARAWTIKEGPKPAVRWARSRPSPSQRWLALLGVAEAMGHPHP